MKKMLIPAVFIISLMLISCGKSYDESMANGEEFVTAKSYQEALESFDNAINKAESAAQSIAAKINAGNLSSTYLKDMEKANSYYQATLEDVSDYSSADLRDLAKQALTAQANPAAVSMYKLLLKKYSDNTDILDIKYELAEVYHKNLRDLRSAIDTYNNIFIDYPDSEQAPKALFSIGYIYANELGENDSATDYYSQFLKNYPDHEMAPSVEFELKYLGKALEEIPELQHLLTKTS